MRIHETESNGVYTCEISGKPVVLALTLRHRQSAKAINATVTIGPRKIHDAQKLARETGADIWVGVAVYHGKHDFKQSFALPYDEFKKFKVGEADFPLGNEARESYAKDGIAFCNWKPQVVKSAPAPAESKPTKAAKPSKKAQHEEQQAARNRTRLDKEFGPIATPAQPASPVKE